MPSLISMDYKTESYDFEIKINDAWKASELISDTTKVLHLGRFKASPMTSLVNYGRKRFLKVESNTWIRFGAMTLSIMALSIMTLGRKGLIVTLSINDTQHNNTLP